MQRETRQMGGGKEAEGEEEEGMGTCMAGAYYRCGQKCKPTLKLPTLRSITQSLVGPAGSAQLIDTLQYSGHHSSQVRDVRVFGDDSIESARTGR